jgi:hypothetical protein
VSCDWEAKSVPAGLTVFVRDTSAFPDGTRKNEVEVRDYKGKVITGLGDWAGVWAPAGSGADARVYIGKRAIEIEYSGLGARDKLDALAALLKAAAGRLG